MKLHRILAVTLRHLYLYKRSVARLMEVFYWPLLDLLLWGFITLYLAQAQDGLPHVVAFFLGAMILWDILYRAQQGISISFLEEVWSRNLLNLFVTPLRPGEFLIATMLISIVKVLVAAVVTIACAWLFYNFNLFILGLSLLPFVLNLVGMGWAIGIVTTALILRFGHKAEVAAWGIPFLFQPLAAVFYPVSVLPDPLQAVAMWVPVTHVFEGMREILMTGTFPATKLVKATLLNVVYLGCALAFFYRMLREVKERGLLLRIGE